MKITVVDFESTGIPKGEEKHALVEVGRTDLICHDDGRRTIEGPWAWFVNPRRKIPIEAMAVHHIRDKDVINAPSIDKVLPEITAGAPDYYCAHKVEFEQNWFTGGETPWLCTHKTALRIWPDAPEHTNQGLRYFLGLDDLPDFDHAKAMTPHPHRAGPDTYVTAHLLRAVLKSDASMTDLLKWSSGPALLSRVHFGMHAGKYWREVPESYLAWILGPKGIQDDRDVRATAKYWQRQHAIKKAVAARDNPLPEGPGELV